MFSEVRMAVVLVLLLATSCTPYIRMRQMGSGEVAVSISVPEEKKEETEDLTPVVDSIKELLVDGHIIMNAIRDSETGEMVATDVIRASKVVARFRNVAERGGYVSIEFDVSVPAEMSLSKWKLSVEPCMRMNGDTIRLEPIYITGKGYREGQLRGYQRYRRFLESIVTDTTDLVWIRQLEIFMQRHFPDIYAMKQDSSYVSDEVAESIFGVTQKEALHHYTRHWRVKRNRWKNDNRERIFRKYVRDPIVREGVRLDTVLVSKDDFIYRYVHTFRSRPGLKKVMVAVMGGIYENGVCKLQLPLSDELTFYISSLASLADMRTRYVTRIVERKVSDRTKALIDFHQGSAGIDTSLSDNASELARIRRCIDDVVSRQEFVLDSLTVTASCSPEGAYAVNRSLSYKRSEALCRYVAEHVPDSWKEKIRLSSVPENWEYFRLLVKNDTLIGKSAIVKIMKLTDDLNEPDMVERRLASLPQYRYLREKIYPRLRSVCFDFHLHRPDMVKDTVHTTEPDTVYQAGVEALCALDYKCAVQLLRPYADYNAALAFVAAGYDHSALALLESLGESEPKVCYLKAIVLSRLGLNDEAAKYYRLAVLYDPNMAHRSNLDPEMSGLREVQKY